jgi:hypothetical protein
MIFKKNGMKKTQSILLALCAVFIFSGCSKEGILDSGSTDKNKSGSITKFAIVNQYMYSLNSSNIDVYDIAHPELPVKINSVKVAPIIETIFSFGNHLYVGAPDAIYIVQTTNPISPVVVGSEVHIQMGCDPVIVKDNIAYSTIRTGRQCGRLEKVNELQVIDVRDVYNPKTLKRINMNYPSGLGYDGSLLFVCDGPGGIAVFDIKTPQNPERIQTIKNVDAVDVITDEGLLIISTPTEFHFYDYTDLNNIVLKNKIVKS